VARVESVLRKEDRKMSEGTAPAPSAPLRRRSVPFVTSLLITLLAVACVAEGFLIYLKQYQLARFTVDATTAGDELKRFKRELEQTNNTLQQYGELIGYADLASLKEHVKDANPPTLEGYLSGLEGKLKTTLSRLDEMQSGWSAMEKARDDAIKAQVTAETEVKKKAEEFRQTADLLAKQLQAEKDARQKDVEDLQQKVAEAEKNLRDSESKSNEAVTNHNAVLAALGKAQERVDRLRFLLAETLRVPPPPGLGPALLANDRLELRVSTAESVQNISYVRLPIPPDRTLAVGMRFFILDSQRRPKCLVQLTNIVPEKAPEKALGLVVEKYSAEPVMVGDPAQLDLAYEELRKPPVPAK
jgi:Skp family chaperone for outer membrane proteins